MNIVSNFGICFDPIADKIFNLCAFAMLMTAPDLALPMFPFLLIIIREVGISGVRVILLSSEERIIVPAERFGKWKAAFQFALIFIFTAVLCAKAFNLPEWIFRTMRPPITAFLFWAVSLYTFASSWTHLWINRRALLAAWNGTGRKG